MEPALLGLILDSTAVIAGERRSHTVRQILEQFKRRFGDIEVGLSVVTIAFEDLLIAAIALQRGFGVATGNVRHFEVVPGLTVVPVCDIEVWECEAPIRAATVRERQPATRLALPLHDGRATSRGSA